MAFASSPRASRKADGIFTLSVEVAPLRSVQHSFHLGTDEKVARKLAEEEFHRRFRSGEGVVTVALMRGRKVFDVFDAAGWFSAGDW